MSDTKKPKAVLNIPLPTSEEDRMSGPVPQPKPMRTQEELTPIALHVATNAELMVRFRDVIGSEDKERASKLIDEVTTCARNLDATITVSEGTRIVVLLMKMVSHPNGNVR